MVEQDFLHEAIQLSVENVVSGGGPFGAVVVRGEEIVGRAANGVTRLNDPTAHAEVLAIREACKNLGTFSLTGCVLYTSCEPCPMCLAAAYWARLDRIVFAATRDDAAEAGFDDAFLYNELTLPHPERTLTILADGVARTAAQTAFLHWKESVGRRY